MPTYRTNGAWGSGISVNLTPAQVDNNFYELRTDLDVLIANPPTADGLVGVTQSGFYLTFHTTLGNELGPIAIPVVYTVWRGDWAPFTIYSAADIFRVVDEGIFSVLQDHTSAATFDPDAAGGSPLAPYYNELIGVSSLPATTSLDELTDVTITSAADGDLIAWDTGSLQWTNRTPGDVLALLAPTLDDLTDVIAPSPAVGQILRYLGGSPDKGWQPDTLSLDALDDVSVAAPSDGDVLTYQAGSPTGWVASPVPAIPSALDDLTDVIAPSPSDGDLLQFDGADWINSAGSAISDLTDAFLPLVGSDLFEISQSTGSPPGSPPVGYESRKATLANILSAGGFTLGSTSIALGGTATTVTGLTLSGTTTLPGSGQIDSSGALGIGVAPTDAYLSVGGTYTTANAQTAQISGTLESSVTTTQSALFIGTTFSPSGASLTTVNALRNIATVDSSAINIGAVQATIGSIILSAGYSGTVTNAFLFSAGGATINGGAITNFAQFRGAAVSVNNGATSGTKTNNQFTAEGITAGAAGATVNNRGMAIVVPSGGASSGTANNRGIYITGNGGTASGGTVNNYAIYNDSTASSFFTGALGIGVDPTDAHLSVGGTYTTANGQIAHIGGTLASSSVGTQSGLFIDPTFSPTGASVSTVNALRLFPTLDNTSLSIGGIAGLSVGYTLGASYSGTITSLFLISATSPTISGGTLSTFSQYRGGAIPTFNNLASGTRTNRQFQGEGITAGAAGGIINNRTAEFVVPSGGASSGTANNRGIYITGNGGTASGGTVNNFAMLSDSTAYSRIEGGLGVGVATRNATNATSPYFYIPTCAGTPTGVPRNAAVGATAMMFDDTAHKLWVYEQSTATWKGVVVA